MEKIKYPYPTKKIHLGKTVRIAYVDEGKGDYTLLMIHGLGSYLPAWQKNIEGLKNHFRCVAVDLPNYGKSSRGDYPFTMNFFARTIVDFIERLQLKNVVLVGHSMGAQIAMTTVLKTRASIQKLVLLAPAGFEVFSAEEKGFFYKSVTPETIKKTSTTQIEQNFALNFFNNELPHDARFMFEDRLRMRADPIEYDHYCRMIPKCVKGMLEAPVFDHLQNINIPTLILFGKGDLLIPNKLLHPDLDSFQVAQSGQQKIHKSNLHMLSGCGHFILWERPGIVNDHISNFVVN
ncbi:MAG: alpha/beta hydrolase [Saprospiraceae bacterium]|nr:alpha/beta hydrolase [Saprospiraceae bacterium]MCB9326004.1 alpha/beta hydrolase [Lewinellaceae bacterium]